MVVLLLLGVGWGAFYFLTWKSKAEAPVVGYAYFVGSGQFIEGTDQGLNDELLVDLHNIRSPAPGKHYYAWLLSDKRDTGAVAVLLATLTVSHGNVHFLYKNKRHSSFLASTSHS